MDFETFKSQKAVYKPQMSKGNKIALFEDLVSRYDREALGLSPKQFTKIQQEWNDSELTFSDIANLIESEMFRQ